MSASAADENYRHVVDIGARAAGDDQPSAGRQGMVGVVIPKDSKQIPPRSARAAAVPPST